jgi:hypothetical protein
VSINHRTVIIPTYISQKYHLQLNADCLGENTLHLYGLLFQSMARISLLVLSLQHCHPDSVVGIVEQLRLLVLTKFHNSCPSSLQVCDGLQILQFFYTLGQIHVLLIKMWKSYFLVADRIANL